MRSQSASIAPARGSRSVAVDIARGIGIILVVYGHALRGAVGPGPMPAWAALQDRIIYSFHMPMFFVVAGLFLWPSIERGRARYLKGRWWAVIYPYLLWSLACGAIELAMSRFVNTPMTVRQLVLIPVVPIGQFWFLYALLLVQVVAAAAFPSKVLLWGAVVLGIVLVTLTGGATIHQRAFLYLPYLAVGVSAAGLILSLQSSPQVLRLAVLVSAGAAFVALSYADWPGLGPRLAVGCVGSIMVLALAALISGYGFAGPLALLGQASLGIFALHVLFTAGTRIGLVLLGLDASSPQALSLQTFTGLLVPLLLWIWSRSNRFGYLLGFGERSARTAATEALESKASA